MGDKKPMQRTLAEQMLGGPAADPTDLDIKHVQGHRTPDDGMTTLANGERVKRDMAPFVVNQFSNGPDF